MLIPGSYRAIAERAVALTLLLALTGCLYGFSGGGLPGNIRTIYIAPIDNETERVELDQQLFRALSDRVPSRLGLRPAAERNADAVLRVTITRYQDAAQNYRTNQTGAVDVLQHQVQITLTVRIIDLKNNEIIFEQAGVQGTGDYQPDTQTDEVARGKAIELLIQRIVDGAQSQW